MNEAYNELVARGFINNETKGVEELLNKPTTFYFGIDPTADSLTIGNYAIIRMAEVLLRHGHHAIIVIGGLTANIGDPSGKDKEREILNGANIITNSVDLELQLSHLLRNHERPEFSSYKIENNMKFYSGSLTKFLSKYGKIITVNQMLTKDSVKSRMESGISFLEFSYQIFQGADFHYLNTTYHCNLQIGGSDQWGNIVTGIDFCSKLNQTSVHGITCPLLTKANGEKFGKSDEGNIWLSKTKTSPWEFYQFFFSKNVEDKDLDKLFKIYSYKSLEEIKELLANTNPLEQRHLLACELIEFLHGKQALSDVLESKQLLFGKATPHSYTLEHWGLLSNTIPVTRIEEVLTSFTIVKRLIDKGIIASMSELNRMIAGKSIKLNGKYLEDGAISQFDLIKDTFGLIEIGKNYNHLIIVQ